MNKILIYVLVGLVLNAVVFASQSDYDGEVVFIFVKLT